MRKIPQKDYVLEVSDIVDACIEDALVEIASQIPAEYTDDECRSKVANGNYVALWEWFDIAAIREVIEKQMEFAYLEVEGDGTSW